MMTKVSLKRKAGFLLTFLAAANIAYGDVAPDPLDSGLSPSVLTHRVWMASEEVNIFLGEERVAINAKFMLVNLSEKDAVLEVGFPTDHRDEVLSLKVFVGGEPASFREESERLYYPGSIDENGIKVNWVLWKMTFPGRSETELRVNYKVRPRRNEDFLSTPYRELIERITIGQSGGSPASDHISKLRSGMTTFSTGYLLVTGAGWYGNIGEALINVFYEGKGPGVIRRFSPEENYSFLPDRLQWKFFSLDPSFNVELEFNPSFTVEEELSIVRWALASDESNQDLKNLHDYLESLSDKMKER